MTAIAFDIRSACPKCAAPVFVRALVPHTTCPACLAEVELASALAEIGRRSFWDDQLKKSELRRRGQSEGPWKTVDLSALTGPRSDLRFLAEPAEPACPECSAELALPADLERAGGALCCPRCGAAVHLRPVPRDGTPTLPTFVSHVLGEDPSELPGVARGEPAKPAASTRAPVRFPCPSCDASLSIDGSSRTVECSYCHTSAYLPDDLWRRLHPVRTARRFQLLLVDRLVGQYRDAERISNYYVGAFFTLLLVDFVVLVALLTTFDGPLAALTILPVPLAVWLAVKGNRIHRRKRTFLPEPDD